MKGSQIIPYRRAENLLGILGDWPTLCKSRKDYELSVKSINEKMRGALENPEKFFEEYGVDFSQIEISDKNEILLALERLKNTNGLAESFKKACNECTKLSKSLYQKTLEP